MIGGVYFGQGYFAQGYPSLSIALNSIIPNAFTPNPSVDVVFENVLLNGVGLDGAGLVISIDTSDVTVDAINVVTATQIYLNLRVSAATADTNAILTVTTTVGSAAIPFAVSSGGGAGGASSLCIGGEVMFS